MTMRLLQLRNSRERSHAEAVVLTNDDLSKVEGKRTELVGRIQERYGYAKDKAEREVDDWLSGI